jgi:queuine tRNA-ribosyltransferase accessory subunit
MSKRSRRAPLEISAEAGTVDDRGDGAGLINLWERRWRKDTRPLLVDCDCPACRRHSRAYVHHLLQAHEMVAEILLYTHNLHHYLRFFASLRGSIVKGQFDAYRKSLLREVGESS